MKVLLKGVLAAILVSLALQAPMWAQKGKPAPQPPPTKSETELTAEFRDGPNDKIYSDGFGPYYTVLEPDRTYSSVVLLDRDGRLAMQISNVQAASPRKVFFKFDQNVRPVPLENSQLICRDYNGNTEFNVTQPSFLTTGEPNNNTFYITTFGEITYGKTGWVYNPKTMFNFRNMPVSDTASSLVRVQINFNAAERFWLFGVMPNYRLWSADTALAGGVVKVTHPFADTWVVEPQAEDDPLPLRSLRLNEAGFKVGVPEVSGVHPGGNCDLGDWVMPFQLTLYKR